MKLERLRVVYFSPTGGTERIARGVAEELGRRLGLEDRKSTRLNSSHIH